ncbi:MAG TPA: hypothetical protein VEA78_10330, partial [Acidimicrobiales bacterium]|nr:hypothetical protein [Acidimicrobiales bacterium]
MRRALEITTAAVAFAVVGAAALVTRDVQLVVVLAFGALVMLSENTEVIFHPGASMSPAFMIVMAATAVQTGGALEVAVGAALVGACGGLYLPHIREQRWGILVFNVGQYALAAFFGALAYHAFGEVNGAIHVVAAIAAALVFATVNAGLVLPHV